MQPMFHNCNTNITKKNRAKKNKEEKRKIIKYDEFQDHYLKVVSATFLLVCFLSLNESTCQTRKNDFYFTSKALFILEKIQF